MNELNELSKKILKRSLFLLILYTILLVLSIWMLDKINTDIRFKDLTNMTYETYDESEYFEGLVLIMILMIIPLMFIIVIVNYIDKILITSSYFFFIKSIFILFLSAISSEIILYFFNLEGGQSIIFIFVFGFLVFFSCFLNAFRKRKRTEICQKIIKEIDFEPNFISKIWEFKTEKNELFPLLFQNYIFVEIINQSFEANELNYFLDFIATKIVFVVFVKRITKFSGDQFNGIELTIVKIPEKTIKYKIKLMDLTTDNKFSNNRFYLNDVGKIRFYKDVIEFLNEKVAFSKVV